MTDNEQRCERNGLPISGCAASEYDCAKFGVCAAGPSVVTPPRQVNGFALCTEPSGVPGRACEMYEGHVSPHRLMPDVIPLPTVPAAPSVSTDHTDEKLKAELLSLCVPVQFSNGYPIEAIPKASLLSFFAIRALGAGRG